MKIAEQVRIAKLILEDGKTTAFILGDEAMRGKPNQIEEFLKISEQGAYDDRMDCGLKVGCEAHILIEEFDDRGVVHIVNQDELEKHIGRHLTRKEKV